jgi:hypothetical protein
MKIRSKRSHSIQCSIFVMCLGELYVSSRLSIGPEVPPGGSSRRKKKVSFYTILDLRIAHDRVGSSIDPNLNGHLKYPNNLDQSLNDVAPDKIRKYRPDYNNRPPSVVSCIPTIDSTSTGYIVNLSDFYSYRIIGKLTVFFQIQEFCQRNQIVDSSTTVVWLSLSRSKVKLV